MPIYLFCFVHINLLHELSDDFRCEFRDFGVFVYQRKEVIGVECCFFFRRNGCSQFGYPLLKGMLLRFVVSGHLGKTVITDFSLKVILVESLNDFIQFANTLCGLFQLTLVFTQASVECDFGLARNHLQKLGFVVFCKSGDSADIIKQGFFDNHVTNLVGTASTLDFSVGGTNEVFFAVFPSASSHLVQLRTAIGTEQHTGEDRHFTERSDLAPSVTNLLHNFKYRFVHNGFVGVLENLPLRGIIVHTATYTATYIDYTVTFKDWNGTVLSAKTYHYGDKVTAPGDPTRAADKTYTYTFAGWDKAVVNCAGNATYTAIYTVKYIDYTIIFQYEDGTVIKKYTVHYGDSVTAPANPAAPSAPGNNYEFCGWDKDVVTTSQGNAVYTAVFVRKYISGDLDGDEKITDADAVYLLMHTFFSDEYPVDQDCDFDGDGKVTDADAVYLLMYTFFPDEYPIQ